MTYKTIYLQPKAPSKPEPGAPCNGCGVCCLAEPCPLGVVLSGKRSGACDALRWDTQGGLYRCAAMVDAEAAVRARLPRWLGWAAGALGPLVRRGAARWIAAGIGCDCTLAPASQDSTQD